jgi:hypothetical protein
VLRCCLLHFFYFTRRKWTQFVHRVSDLENGLSNSCEENLDKSLDVFVSYRRSNGSQLARYINATDKLLVAHVFEKVPGLIKPKYSSQCSQEPATGPYT